MSQGNPQASNLKSQVPNPNALSPNSNSSESTQTLTPKTYPTNLTPKPKLNMPSSDIPCVLLFRRREAAAAGRKDAKLKTVVISERWDKKAAKHNTASVPFPYTSKQLYEATMRQPLGREYNVDTSFR